MPKPMPHHGEGTPPCPGRPPKTAAAAGDDLSQRSTPREEGGDDLPTGQPTAKIGKSPITVNVAQDHRDVAGCRRRDGEVSRCGREYGRHVTGDTGASGSVWKLSEAKKRCPQDTLIGPRERALAAIAHFAIDAYTEAGEIVLDADGDHPGIIAETHVHGRHCAAMFDAPQTARRIIRNARINVRSAGRKTGPLFPIPVRSFPGFKESSLNAGLAILTASIEQQDSAIPRADDADGSGLTDADSMCLAKGFHSRLQQCRRHLKANGTLIVYIPRFRHGGALADTPGLVLAALAQCGFTPIDRRAVVLDTAPYIGRRPHADAHRYPSAHQGHCHPTPPIHEDLILAVTA